MAGKGRPPLCKICGTKLNVDTAYRVVTYNSKGTAKSAFYCSKEEYEENISTIENVIEQKEEKPKKVTQKKKESKQKEPSEKIPTDKDNAYYLICRIIDRQEIINTILWKEWKIWNSVASDGVILQYLKENEQYLTSAISRIENKEFNRIRYLSAILKNKLGDFQPKTNVEEKPKIRVDESFYHPVATRNNKRRSLEDLEDAF